MPRVHFVKKARKSCKALGIKKGNPYYWWKFRNGGKQTSATYPRPSQLTQSSYLSSILSIQESIDDFAVDGADSMRDFAAELSGAADEVRSLGEECSGNASNMESAFPNGCPTIDMLNQRNDDCERIADELETAAADAESKAEEAEDVDENGEDMVSDWSSEKDDIISSIDWSTE